MVYVLHAMSSIWLFVRYVVYWWNHRLCSSTQVLHYNYNYIDRFTSCMYFTGKCSMCLCMLLRRLMFSFACST